MTTRGKTTPDSTPGSWAPHTGNRSRLLVPSELGTCVKCDSPLTPINEADQFDTRAGEPGDTRCSDHTCPLSDKDQPTEAATPPTAGVAALIDPIIASQAPLPVRPRYVICLRDPDSANEFHAFNNGDGDIVILDIDLGATLDHADDHQYTEFVENHLTIAATIADADARAKYLTELRSVVDNAADARPDLHAAIDYMDDQPVRKVVASSTVLSFEPQAIRDHFDVEESDIAAWVAQASDADLAHIASAALSNDKLYDAFHDVLTSEIRYTLNGDN